MRNVMNLISRNTRNLSRSKLGIVINALLNLILLLLITTGVYSRQASAECARKANTVRDVDLMDQPPTYSTKNGWVYGKRMDVLNMELVARDVTISKKAASSHST
jgi:hypothetical protein